MLSTLAKITPTVALDSFERFILNDFHRAKKFLNVINPDLLEEISKKKALRMFKIAAKETPAYNKFLLSLNCNPHQIKDIQEFNESVPQTDKVSYIKKFNFEERCRNGHLPTRGNIDESGGTSGKATNWVHDVSEEELLSKSVNFEYNYIFEGNKKNFIVLSAWSTGPWATGVKFCELMEKLALVKNTATDPKEIIETLKMFGKDKNYLLAGYPPFIKNLLDDYQEEINWKGYNIDLVTGGEGVPLEWVYYVRKFLRPEAKIVSSYGASDIDIGIGFETPFCFFIRELVNQDEALRIRLFGKDDMPMIFQYNPLVHYIRETKNEQGKPEIEITLLDGKAASTKIKYNLHDEGKRYSYHEMIRTIEGYYPHFLSEFSKKGGNLQEILHLPFLCIFGRSDGTLSFDGANVFPDQIQSGILRKPALAKITNRFKMEKKYDHKHTTQFHIHIELKNKVTPKKNMELQFLTAILSELVKINPDFRESYNKNKTLSPIINLYTFEHSLFSKDDAKCKNIYSLLPPGKHKALMVKKKTKYKKT